MHKFKISGIIGEDITTDSIALELNKANGKELFIDIDSMGGCPITAIGMFSDIRRYAKENNIIVTTRASGFVASASTIPYLAGDVRIVNEFMQPFIHEPWFTSTSATTTDEFRRDAEQLFETRDLMANFYSQNTSMSKEQALELMANDTWLSADECIELGFATEIEKLSRTQAKIVASIKSKLTINNKQMSEQKKGWIGRLAAVMKTTKAQLELADVSGLAIVFPDLEESEKPSVDAKITVDGDAMFNGTVETDEYIFTVAEGVVSEMIDKTEINEDEVIEELLDIIEAKDEEIQNLTASLEKTKKLYAALGKDPKQVRNGKTDGAVENRASAAMNRIKNRKNK